MLRYKCLLFMVMLLRQGHFQWLRLILRDCKDQKKDVKKSIETKVKKWLKVVEVSIYHCMAFLVTNGTTFSV